MKANECKHLIFTENYAQIEQYLSSIAYSNDIDINVDLKINLISIMNSASPRVHKKLLETFELLEKLKKHKFLVEVLGSNQMNNYIYSVVLLKSYLELGSLEKFRIYLCDLCSYLVAGKLWSKLDHLENIVDRQLFPIEFYELKVRSLIGLGRFDELINVVSSINLIGNKRISSILLDFVDSDIPELVSFKVKLILKSYDITSEDRLKKLILFYENEDILTLLKPKQRSGLDYKIIKSESSDISYTDTIIKNEKKNIVNDDKEQFSRDFLYMPSLEEKKLLTRLKLNDPMFDDYNRDIAISFINLNMYKLVHEYLKQFDLDDDGIYLKLECLNFMGKYSQVVDIINSKKLEGHLAFRYLKALAYLKMGVVSLAKSELVKVAKEDSDYRNVRELLK